MKIKNANACYTGGNIYCYYGELEDGRFFAMSDSWCDFSVDDAYVCILDEPESEDLCDDTEWFETHTLKELYGYDAFCFFESFVHWMIENKPKGNYQTDDLIERIEVQDV